MNDYTDKIIYYPMMHLPDNNWLRSAILYNDQLTSIVPNDDWSPSELENKLMDNGLYHSIPASNLVFDEGYKKLENNYINILNSGKFKTFRKKNSKLIKTNFSISIRKMSDKIFHELRKRKLMGEETYENFYEVDAVASMTYMAMLANFASNLEKSYAHVSTDFEEMNEIVYQNTQLSQNLTLTVNSLLPIFSDSVPIDKIIEFKRRHNDLFIFFKTEYQSLARELSGIKAENDAKEITYNVSLRIKAGLLEVEKAMKLYDKSVAKATVFGAIASGAGIAVASGLGFPIVPGLIISAISGFITVSLNLISSPFEKDDNLYKSKYAYLHKVKREFPITS